MSSHWYQLKDGRPCYEIAARNGAMRAVTLRDARQLALVPSVTTVLGEAAKPALVNWMIDQALQSALTLPQNPGESLDAFMHRAREDSRKQAQQAAERGSQIHDACERYYKGVASGMGSLMGADDLAFVMPIVEAVRGWCGEQHWVSEAYFADRERGYGGKVDLHCPTVVLDFKGKDMPEDGSKRLAYDEHGMQLAAYARGLKLPRDCRYINVFFDRTRPGVVRIHEWSAEEADDYWERFKLLLEYWKRRNRYWPEQQQVAA